MNNETLQKNILAILEHGNETRKQLRDLEGKVDSIATLRDQLNQVELQLNTIMKVVYQGGRTDGD